MTFESGIMPEDWRSAVMFHCTRVKERENNIRIIYWLLNLVGKIYPRILIDSP